MSLLKPSKVAIITATVCFFLLTLTFNILAEFGVLPFNQFSMNIVFLMISLAAVYVLSRLRDYTKSNDGCDADEPNDFNFLTLQMRFISIASISFLFWLF